MCSNIHPLIDLSSMYLLPYLQVQEKSLKMILWCSAERNKICYFYSYQGPRSYSLLCCITLNSGVLESGFLSSWPLRSQWEPSEKPPKPEADLSLLVFPEDPDTSCIPVRPLEPSNRKTCLSVSPSSLWTSSEDLSRAFHRARESKVGQDRF